MGMGGLCSRSVDVDNAPGGGFSRVNGHFSKCPSLLFQSSELKRISSSASPSPIAKNAPTKQLTESFSFPGVNMVPRRISSSEIDNGMPHLSRPLSHKSRSTISKQAAAVKVSEMGAILGKAGTAGLGKAVEVLDSLSSSMANLNINSSFNSAVVTKRTVISILAFEVANTVVKGANLMQFLLVENIRHLKEVVLLSEGVKNLVSTDMNDMLRIVAVDKREELKVFTGEVVRFGNLCKDPRWHNLDRYFGSLSSEFALQKPLSDESEIMQQLMNFVHYTAELYHEMHALDRYQQDCQRKLHGVNRSKMDEKEKGLEMVRADWKNQKKQVKSLKKKSLWSKILEEVMEKLVDIVMFLHWEIHQAFGGIDDTIELHGSFNKHEMLGPAGLALHYANIVTQIDMIASRPGSVPQNTRDALYQALPPAIKSALRIKLQAFQSEGLTVAKIKAEMEKTLRWLTPIAAHTTKAHHGFGWVGEWANSGLEMSMKHSRQTDFLKIETLYYADREKTDTYILDMVVWLHPLVGQARARAGGEKIRPSMRAPMQSTSIGTAQSASSPPTPPGGGALTVEDYEMLRSIDEYRKPLGRSRSHEFLTENAKLCKHRHHYYNRLHYGLCKSSNHSPIRASAVDQLSNWKPCPPPFLSFNLDRLKTLDLIDRVDTI